MRIFIICTFHQVLLGQSSQRVWAGQDMGKLRNEYIILIGIREGEIPLWKWMHESKAEEVLLINSVVYIRGMVL